MSATSWRACWQLNQSTRPFQRQYARHCMRGCAVRSFSSLNDQVERPFNRSIRPDPTEEEAAKMAYTNPDLVAAIKRMDITFEADPNAHSPDAVRAPSSPHRVLPSRRSRRADAVQIQTPNTLTTLQAYRLLALHAHSPTTYNAAALADIFTVTEERVDTVLASVRCGYVFENTERPDGPRYSTTNYDDIPYRSKQTAAPMGYRLIQHIIRQHQEIKQQSLSAGTDARDMNQQITNVHDDPHSMRDIPIRTINR